LKWPPGGRQYRSPNTRMEDTLRMDNAPPPTAETARHPSWPLPPWALVVIGVLFVGLYFDTFAKYLIPRWTMDPSAQHGWLVIPISLVVTWMKRDRLKELPIRPNAAGLYLVGFGLFLHLFEKAVDLNGPSPVSIPVVIAGLVWHFLGTAFLKELAFPIAYLLFFCPIPGGFTELVSFPLRRLATEGSKWLANLMGVHVYGAGMNMEFFQPRGLEWIRLEVADPCSGLHSLMAIKALHAITAYLTRLKLGWKWVLFFCAIPIALAANVVRITAIILIGAYISKEFAVKVFHDYSSPVLFIIAFGILIGIGRFMEWATGALKSEKEAAA